MTSPRPKLHPMPKRKAEQPKKLRLTVYLPEHLMWKLREKAIGVRIKSDTVAMEEAVSAWVSDDKPDAKLHHMMDVVLSDTVERPGLEKYLGWAVDSVRKRKKSGG